MSLALKMNSAVKCYLFAHFNHKTHLFTHDYLRQCALNVLFIRRMVIRCVFYMRFYVSYNAACAFTVSITLTCENIVILNYKGISLTSVAAL